MPQRPAIQIEKLQTYEGHRGSIYALAVDAQERYLFSAGDDGVVARWDLDRKGDTGEGMLTHSRGIYALALAEAQDLLLVGASDGTVHFVDLRTRAIRHQFRRDSQSIYHIEVDPTKELAWILHGMGFLSIIDLNDFSVKGSIRLSQKNLRCMALDIANRCGFIGASDGNIYQVNLDTGTVMTQWSAHQPSVFAIHLVEGGQQLLSGGRDAHLSRWRLSPTPMSLARIPAHNFTVNHIVSSPDGQYLLTASRDKTFKLWQQEDLALLKVIDFTRHQAHKHSVNKIKWLRSDNSVISCGDDRQLFRWDIRTDVP